MDNLNKLISDIRVMRDRNISLTMDGVITILENFKEEEYKSNKTGDILLDFLFYLNDKSLINNYDFDYEEEINNFLKR